MAYSPRLSLEVEVLFYLYSCYKLTSKLPVQTDSVLVSDIISFLINAHLIAAVASNSVLFGIFLSSPDVIHPYL